MFYDDLTLYQDKKFRSFNHINHLWETIESYLLFYFGILNYLNITIIFDPETLYLTITSDYNTYCNETIAIKNNHCLNLSKDFTIELNMIITFEEEYTVKNSYCSYCYSRSKDDEGIIAMNLELAINKITEINKLKNYIVTSLSLEAQYAINKIFTNTLDFEDNIKVDIDCFYEFIYADSKTSNRSFLESANILLSKNLIDNNTFFYAKKLNEILEGEKNEKRKNTN